MAWKVTAVDSITRREFFDLTPVATAAYMTQLNGPGTVNTTVQTRDALHPVSDEVFRMLCRDQRRTTVVVEEIATDGTRYPIADSLVDKSTYSPMNGTLTLSGESVAGLMKSRMYLEAGKYEAYRKITTRNFWNGTIENACWGVILQSIGPGEPLYNSDTGALVYSPGNDPRMRLPVSVVYHSNTRPERRYFEFRDRQASAILEDFQAEEGGPDIVIVPSYDSADGKFKYQAHIGRDLVRYEVTLPFDQEPGFDTLVTDLTISTDDTRTATSVIASGGGQGSSMVSAVASFSDVPAAAADGLFLDRTFAAKQADTLPVVISQAREELTVNNRAVETWSFNVQARSEGWQGPTWFRPGVAVRVNYPGDPVRDAGQRLFQIVKVSGNTSTSALSLEVEQIG